MPAHVNQFTAAGRFPNGASSARYDCTVAVGMMALDDFTGGAIRPTATEFRRRQNDQSGGIGLNDVAVVWKSYGLPQFTNGSKRWGAIMDRLRAGKPVALQGWSGALGRFAVGRPVAHAIYATRATPGGMLVIHDPLRNAAITIPEADVQRFYFSGLALAGWGTGTYAGRPATSPTTTPVTTTPVAMPFINIPAGKLLTVGDIDNVILAAFDRAGTFANDPAGISRSIARQKLLAFVGQPWNKATQDAMQAVLMDAANQANPIGTIGNAIGAAIGEGAFVLVVGGLIAALFLLGAWRLVSK